MSQLEFFKKREGMTQARSADRPHYERACRIARWLGENHETVTIDDVRRYAIACGDPLPSGNYMGSIFRGWILAGYTTAEHEGSHGRTIKKWSLPK